MKLFDGQNTLTAERKDEQFIVYLTGTQVNQQELEFIKSKTNLVSSEDEEYAFKISYPLSNKEKSLKSLMLEMKSELERLELVLKLKTLSTKNSGYKVPFVHPENIFFIDGDLAFIHIGIRDGIAPMNIDDTLALSQYKALTLAILNPKISYDNFVNGEMSLRDKFSQALSNCDSFEEVLHLVETKLTKERQKEEAALVKVSKGRYRFFKYAGSVAVVAAIAMGVLTIIDQKTTIPKQKAIMTAQADFITSHYDKTLDDLKSYQPKQLSKDARFVLASSSINLANLSQTQKAAVLNNISSTTDDNTLNYWIYQGRGEFEKALNLAKNIGDDQLTLLAYTDLYQATKLNTSMNGDEKQKKLEEYNKQIQELSKSLGK
ncbi:MULTISPECIES: type VII secretion protein EssB [Lactococcus]|jgi:type VII secretion protein EssB|uniref:Type VII secretion protein EssB n=1 Tax=Lactococcus lactis subsp. lactis TaxID=1360 RepID=A0A2Z3KR41_LACLL|nr:MULTISPECIES: type VII secretion protein EssB [Lactococcus]AWN66379.1 type VII secretion protein EssB [Lactococcus lactis subsp. lactis]MBK0029527.1 type VII secretion protein EssB [Lactococcus sp. S47]MDR1823392.1 type VII secretion protein EssB [Lactococcus lactis]QNL92154.1 type VII secretion protein EssB [Lactococcus lactis]